MHVNAPINEEKDEPSVVRTQCKPRPEMITLFKSKDDGGKGGKEACRSGQWTAELRHDSDTIDCFVLLCLVLFPVFTLSKAAWLLK